MIRILGGGWYGCQITKTLLDAGYEVELHEIKNQLFSGASGANPARLHIGPHYPRSKATRRLSQENYKRFMAVYGHLTAAVPINIYAIAKYDSMVDFGNYVNTLRSEIDLVVIETPEQFGLQNVEGAILTGERHILVNDVRRYFEDVLQGHIRLNTAPDAENPEDYSLTIDCTFCSRNGDGVDRYEPCVTFLFEGRWDKAVTIMDGPFPSFYPHFKEGAVSLTSAKFTPFGRVGTYAEAKDILNRLGFSDIEKRRDEMVASMSYYYPSFFDEYRYLDALFAIRAMPRSGADSRIFNVVETEDGIRVMAGKIDAIFAASDVVLDMVKKHC